ncbi:hypothetical protein, partial [Escherichia coli]
NIANGSINISVGKMAAGIGNQVGKAFGGLPEKQYYVFTQKVFTQNVINNWKRLGSPQQGQVDCKRPWGDG